MNSLTEKLQHGLWNPSEDRLRAPFRVLIQFTTLAVTFLFLLILVERFVSPHINSIIVAHGITLLLATTPYFISVYFGTRVLDKRPFKNIGIECSRQWIRQFFFGLLVGSFLMTTSFLFIYAFGWLEIHGIYSTVTALEFAALTTVFILLVSILYVAQLINTAYLIKNTSEGLSGYISIPQAVALAVILRLIIVVFLFSSNSAATAYAIFAETIFQLIFILGYVYTSKIAFPVGFGTGWTAFILYVYGGYSSGFSSPISLFIITYDGPVAITGGEFGFGGGLVALFNVVFGIFILFGWLRYTDQLQLQEVIYTRTKKLPSVFSRFR